MSEHAREPEAPDFELRLPWMQSFIENLRLSPNVTGAARIAGISHTRVYEARDEDLDFRAAWDDAIEQAHDGLERFAHQISTTGIETHETRRTIKRELLPVVLENGQTEMRLTVTEETTVEITGHLVSPMVMVTLLRAHRPKKFAPPVRIQHGGDPSSPIKHEIYRPLPPERALELAQKLLELVPSAEPEHPDVEGRSAA